MVVENAFGRLKGRWQCLLKRMDFMLENVPNIVATCVILHNICEMFGDHFQSEWELHEEQQSETSTDLPQASRNQTASGIRDALAQYLSNNE